MEAENSVAMTVLLVVLGIQTIVLWLVLLRLNRLLQAVAEIGKVLPPPRVRTEESLVPMSAGANLSDQTQFFRAPASTQARRESFIGGLNQKFIQIPADEFIMGNSDPDSPANEQPAHVVKLTQAFWLAETPVTNAQYEQFDPDHRKRRPAWNGDDHPVVCVNWNEAAAFCLWLEQRDGREYRLPTEAQWEFAARGKDCRIFPWGNMWDSTRCNSEEPGDTYTQTSPVTAFPEGVSPHGILDMAGNVWEWCADGFTPNYGDGSARTDPVGQATGSHRVCRGGSWMNQGFACRVTMRARRAQDFSDVYIGFRIACLSGPDANAESGKSAPAKA